MNLLRIIIFLNLISLNCVNRKVGINKSCPSFYDILSNRTIYTFVDKMPEYEGGNVEFVSYLTRHLVIPNQSFIQASFQIEFVIDSNGQLIMAKFLNKENSELTDLEKAIINVLNNSPSWQSGKCNGRNVPVKLFFPITLNI